MFHDSALLYDTIYAFKNYKKETKIVYKLIKQFTAREVNSLLDVACGTGQHLIHLCDQVGLVEGLDLDQGLLDVARERCPGVTFHQADMVNFDLGRCYDTVVCLFSSIGYVRTLPRLHQAVQSMSDHLEAGGVLLVEPWFSIKTFKPGFVDGRYFDEQTKKFCRFVRTEVYEGDTNPISVLDMHYLVGTSERIQHFAERHELGLFGTDDYVKAFEAAGLGVIHDSYGLTGRGAFIGVKSSESSRL
jgi:SAM-dependent methyltransferase